MRITNLTNEIKIENLIYLWCDVRHIISQMSHEKRQKTSDVLLWVQCLCMWINAHVNVNFSTNRTNMDLLCLV